MSDVSEDEKNLNGDVADLVEWGYNAKQIIKNGE